jgi:hypothetical protein
MKFIRNGLSWIIFILMINPLRAQFSSDVYDMFRSTVYTGVRTGNETQNFESKYVYTPTGRVNGSETLEFTSSRTTFDIMDANFSKGFGNLVSFGLFAGCNVGVSSQKKEGNGTHTGTIPDVIYPNDMNGNQGNDFSANSWALSFELRTGAALGYVFDAEQNIQVSAGYSIVFWGKGNMGFYVNPKFFGGFYNVNASWRRWCLYTRFRTNTFEDLTWGARKSFYVGFRPVYTITPGGLFVGGDLEFWHAHSQNVIRLDPTENSYALKANAFLTGVSLGIRW